LFGFSIQLLFETFLFLRIFQPDVIINVHRPSCKSPVTLVTFNKAYIFSAVIGKGLVRFHENPSNGSRVVPWGQTDRQTEGRTVLYIYIYIYIYTRIYVWRM